MNELVKKIVADLEEVEAIDTNNIDLEAVERLIEARLKDYIIIQGTILK